MSIDLRQVLNVALIEHFVVTWQIPTLVENRFVIPDVNKARGGGLQFAYIVTSFVGWNMD